MSSAAQQSDSSYVCFATPPPYAEADPKAATAAVKNACAAAQRTASELAREEQEPTWTNLVVPLDSALERIEREYSLVSHLHAVTASPAWDKANNACIALVVATFTAIGQDAGLYKRFKRLDAAGPPAVPDGRARILGDMLKQFELAGVGLPGKARAEFGANEKKLSELGTRYEENVREATAAWKEAVNDEASLGDMPADMKAAARAKDGWQISLLDPSYAAYMAHGTDRDLRERLARARNARASDLEKGTSRDNLPLVRKIMRLRWQQAKALGYPDPATMLLARRMAKDPATVASFLAELAETARPHAVRELELLREFAAKELGLDELQYWDMPFVSERYKLATTGISASDIRPYFGTDKVLEGLFACAAKLFGLGFEAVEKPVWDDAVYCLDVTREGESVGRLYVDLEARPTKRGGAWAHGAQTRCKGSAGMQLPTALINCNFTAAAPGATARLGWEEVITIFHEAGHALHHLLGKIDDFCASGMNGVEWDAVELPSQFLENFAWRPETALAMSAHESTGEPLPQEMFAKLEAQRNFLPGLFVTRQLALARFDLELHRNEDADPLALWEESWQQNMVTPRLAEDRVPCSFGHIFAGGYATGYYGYLWADVLAADAYEMFAKPAADQEKLGRLFAAEVLERGGSRDASDNFYALRGREPDPQALLRRLGLA